MLLSTYDDDMELFKQDDDGTYSPTESVMIVAVSKQYTIIGGDYQLDNVNGFTAIVIE